MGISQAHEATFLTKNSRDSNAGSPQARLEGIKTDNLIAGKHFKGQLESFPRFPTYCLGMMSWGLQNHAFKSSFDPGMEPMGRGWRYKDHLQPGNSLSKLGNKAREKLRIALQGL